VIRRRHAWQSALSQECARARESMFTWGSHDCVTFAADCVLAMTGFDPLGDWRGAYDSEIGAGRLLVARGHGSLEDAIAERLGPPLSNVARMGRGDVALVDRAGTRAAGICLGEVVAVPAQTAGLVYVSRSAALAAWRI